MLLVENQKNLVKKKCRKNALRQRLLDKKDLLARKSPKTKYAKRLMLESSKHKHLQLVYRRPCWKRKNIKKPIQRFLRRRVHLQLKSLYLKKGSGVGAEAYIGPRTARI